MGAEGGWGGWREGEAVVQMQPDMKAPFVGCRPRWRTGYWAAIRARTPTSEGNTLGR